MVEFAAYIEEKWNLAYEVAEDICHYYEGGSSKYFVNDYVPTVSTQIDMDTLSEVFAFLDKQKELDSVRTRARNVLEKAELLDAEYEDKIALSISEAEIDDLYIGFRTNVRTRGQIAIGKGLKELADKVDLQEETGDFSEAAKAFIGCDDSIKTEEDVRNGVRDILAEVYGYEEGARIMLREYAEDEGHIELHFKKKTKKFDAYRSGEVRLSELSHRDILALRDGEQKDEIKVKIAVPLFQVMELINTHFIENSDCMGIDIIREALDDAWERLLRPMVEESVKTELFDEALLKVSSEIKRDLRPLVEAQAQTGKSTLLVVTCYSEEALELLILDNDGNLLRATTESIREFGRPFVSKKIKQLFEVYHPSQIAILGNAFGEFAESVVEQSVKVIVSKPDVKKIAASTKVAGLLRSQYFKEHSAGLSEECVKSFAYGLAILKPFSIVSQIGVDCFSIHKDEKLVGTEYMGAIVDELYTLGLLKYGVEIGKKRDHLLLNLGIDEKQLEAVRAAKKEGLIQGKSGLYEVKELSGADINNIAGYLVFPNSTELLDKSTVHPAEFGLVNSICDEIGLDVDRLTRNISALEEFEAEDKSVEQFIRQNIAVQLRVAQRYQSLSDRPVRKMRLRDLQVDSILEGRVTNITSFGCFVDINAFSDGLVHISELANDYVDSPDQVVKEGDLVKVKVIEVNRKKKRISLSMKQADNGGIKVRASRAQLDDLANFFTNR